MNFFKQLIDITMLDILIWNTHTINNCIKIAMVMSKF